jgi:hypothetical protein
LPREISCRYVDPLDAVWLACAERIGLRVVRSDDVYAATDGRGTLMLGRADALDVDDCAAQMIFHELCHSLVEGPGSLEREDWGLDNATDRDLPSEHACLRVQALLADEWRLRRVLAPTTEHRAFYDRLPADPLTPPHDPTVLMARAAAVRAERSPWAPHLSVALEATSVIVRAVSEAAVVGFETLLSRLDPPRERHALGFPLARSGHRTCGECAWRHRAGPGRRVDRCRQGRGARVDVGARACERFEPALDCEPCGACCREAYGAVQVRRGEPFSVAHAELLTREGRTLWLVREGERCPALDGEGSAAAPYRCRHYDERPRTCRDFERGGEHCLTARRRVGLSR